MNRYRICWISKITGYGGHGSYIFNCDTARSIARHMNRRHPDVLHYADRETIEVVG